MLLFPFNLLGATYGAFQMYSKKYKRPLKINRVARNLPSEDQTSKGLRFLYFGSMILPAFTLLAHSDVSNFFGSFQNFVVLILYLI